MAFDAFFPKITLPSNKTDVRKGGGLGIRVAGKFMVADAFQGGEATNGLIAWLKDNNAEQIDLAVATHAHGDHTGGFYDIVEAGIPIKEFRCYHIDSIRGGNAASREDSDNLLKLIRWLQIRGTRVLFVDHGDVIKFEDISWHIYRNQPARAAADDTNAWEYVNNGSLVLYSPELQGIIFGDGPENPKDAIAYFQKKFGKIEILIWFLISHHGNCFSLSNAVAAKDAGAKFAYESCVEADGPGTTSWTEFGARRVVQQKITVWMQNQNIYIHAAAGKITFKQGSKTLTFNVPYQGEEKEGWVKNTVGWWYRYKDGSWPAGRMVALPWSKGIGTFCFNDRGYMVTGWQHIDGTWYYFDKTNGYMKTGWIKNNGYWYYLDAGGLMLTGWLTYKNKKCYLEPDAGKNQGHAYCNCTVTIGGKTYTFDDQCYALEVPAGTPAAAPATKPAINQNYGFKGYNVGKRTDPIMYIVIHYTGAEGTAKNNIDYFNSANRSASADFFVGHNGEIWQYTPDVRSYYAWHCGGGRQSSKGGTFYGRCKNANSIGIELCTRKINGAWTFTDETVAAAKQLVRYLMDEYGIKAVNVIRHFDVTGKACPNVNGWLEPSGKWDAFKASLTSGSAAPAAGQIYRVRKSADDVRSQIGAFTVLANAKAKAAANPGYHVYDSSGKEV